MLSGKKVVVGVTGSIAAYKAAYLVRQLVKLGADVHVLMSKGATDFVTPLTLSTLSKNPVHTELISVSGSDWNNHVQLAESADLMIIAPASLNTISKMTHGLCDNLLLAVFFSARCPVFVAPAMDLEMYKHAATQSNLKLLKERNIHILEPGKGELASGLHGQGRMQEPEEIVDAVMKFFSVNFSLRNKKFLVTAGPTHEAIDPVRFIGNYSSGKMGISIAKSLAAKGAEVELVCGPISEVPQMNRVNITHVVSTSEMYSACIKLFPRMDGAVMAAAVADFKPDKSSKKKIKKSSERLSLTLTPTEDILMALSEIKRKNQILVGFALETEDGIENACLKLKKKKLDHIVLNSLQDQGAGFGHDTNKITIIDRDNKIFTFGLKDKKEVAEDIVQHIFLK